MGLLTDRVNNKMEESNLINEHALNREPVPLISERRICDRGTQRQFSENICSEDDLRSRIFGTFFVKFLACLPLLGFSNIYKLV